MRGINNELRVFVNRHPQRMTVRERFIGLHLPVPETRLPESVFSDGMQGGF